MNQIKNKEENEKYREKCRIINYNGYLLVGMLLVVSVMLLLYSILCHGARH